MLANDKLIVSAVSPNDLYFSLNTGSSGFASYLGTSGARGALVSGIFTNSTSISLVFGLS